jgi:hypothetical protein
MNAFEQAVNDIGSIRTTAEVGVQIQWLQTSLLANMSKTLRSIDQDLAHLREQQAEAVAIQQQMLARDSLQSSLEEFIYQSQKLVGECQQATLPPTARYFLLRGLLRHVEHEGIAPPVIRGRDNKAAFDAAISGAAALQSQLQADPEVRKAIAWADQLADHRRRKQEEREAERDAEQARLGMKRARANQITRITVLSALGFLVLAFLGRYVGCCMLPQIFPVKSAPAKVAPLPKK